MFVLFGSWSHIFLLFISRRIFSLHYLGVLFLSFHKNTLLDSRAVGRVFMGYNDPNKRGCECYHSSNRTYFVSTDITFHERAFFSLVPSFKGSNNLEWVSVPSLNEPLSHQFLVVLELPICVTSFVPIPPLSFVLQKSAPSTLLNQHWVTRGEENTT